MATDPKIRCQLISVTPDEPEDGRPIGTEIVLRVPGRQLGGLDPYIYHECDLTPIPPEALHGRD